jgi:hypothetical protein
VAVQKVFTPILKATRNKSTVKETSKRLGKEEKVVMNPKRERAKSRVVKEIKAVFQFEQKSRGK